MPYAELYTEPPYAKPPYAKLRLELYAELRVLILLLKLYNSKEKGNRNFI